MTCGDMAKGHPGPMSQAVDEAGLLDGMSVGKKINWSKLGVPQDVEAPRPKRVFCNCQSDGYTPHDAGCDALGLTEDKCAHANDEVLATDKASHFSDGKAGVDQIPVEILMEWGKVFTMGAEKYGRDNWKGGTDWHEFYGSALRHIFAFWNGEDDDPESGLPHLAHAIWNLATLRYYRLHGLGKDTR